MPAADELSILEELPFATRELASATLRAGRQLLSSSAAGIAPEAAQQQGLVTLRRTALELKFFLARDGQEVRFFFVKRQRPTVRSLAGRLQLTLLAVPPPSSATAAEPSQSGAGRSATTEACSYRLMVPPFLLIRPTPDELTRYAPAGTTAENGVLLRTGPSGQYVLGIRNPEAEKNAQVVYTTRERQPLDRFWAEPFLDLVETLRAWLAGGASAATEVPLPVPTDPSAMSDVHAILYWFVRGYCSMEHAYTLAQPLPPPLAMLMPSYQTAEYQAEINLCVDRLGRFVRPDEPQPMALGMKLTVGRELGQLVARVTLSPPDFLVAGEMHATFLGELRRSTPNKVLKALELSPSDWSDFLSSAAERLVVFRVERSSSGDTDAVVLSGTWRREQRTLILRTVAKVDAAAKPMTVKLSEVTLCYDSLAGSGQTLDNQIVTYFMRLALALKQWIAALG
jgi:hypothetical protein